MAQTTTLNSTNVVSPYLSPGGWSSAGGYYQGGPSVGFTTDIAWSALDNSVIPTTATINSVRVNYSLGQAAGSNAGLLISYITLGGAVSQSTGFSNPPDFPSFATQTRTFLTQASGAAWSRATIFTHKYGMTITEADGGSTFYIQDLTYLVNFTLVAPTVATGGASNVTGTGATLNGTLNPNGGNASYPASYKFQYGLTTAYGSETTLTGGQTGTGDISVMANISGLTGGTTYHFRLVGSNADSTVNGADQTFTTGTGQSVLMTF